jgi:molecular chaperone GrpE
VLGGFDVAESVLDNDLEAPVGGRPDRISDTLEDQPPARPPDGPGGLLEWLSRIDNSMIAIQDELRAGNQRAAAREHVIDRLHEENQRLRAGETQLLLRPILTDLQRLRNELLRECSALPEVLPADRVADLLRSLSVSVELTLERGGIRVIRPTVGDSFDPARHRPMRVTEAATPDEDGTIVAVLGDGYLDTVTDRAVAPATVHVRRWTAPTGNDNDQGERGHAE